jgi:hypothetical protein
VTSAVGGRIGCGGSPPATGAIMSANAYIRWKMGRVSKVAFENIDTPKGGMPPGWAGPECRAHQLRLNLRAQQSEGRPRLSRAVALGRVYLGASLPYFFRTQPNWFGPRFTKSLKYMASPTGFEPVLPP